MKRLVLIDGENLSRGVRNLLGSVDAPAPREVLERFNFRALINEVLGDEQKAQVLFFGARLRLFDESEEIAKQSSEAIHLQSKLVNVLQKQGINFIKSGHLRARESKPCPRCNHTQWRLIEKGVDVGLAVRMIVEAKPKAEIILFSADTDLVPAVKTAIKAGARIVFVGYEYQPVLALAKEASATRLITKQMAEKALGAGEKDG